MAATSTASTQASTVTKAPTVELRWLRKSRDETVLQRKAGEGWEDIPTVAAEEPAPAPAAGEEEGKTE